MVEQDPTVAEMVKYLATVPSGYVTDSFIRLGLTGWITGLKAMRPTNGRHIAGPAVTVQFAPIRGKKSSKYNIYSIFREAGPGAVVIVAGGTDDTTMGGNMCTQAMVAGLAGLIVDGGIRDVEDIRELDLPILYRRPAIRPDTNKEIAAVNAPVTCAGARIHAGDIIVADYDGGIVIPPEFLVEVVENVRDIARMEELQDRMIRENAPMDELRKLILSKKLPAKK